MDGFTKKNFKQASFHAEVTRLAMIENLENLRKEINALHKNFDIYAYGPTDGGLNLAIDVIDKYILDLKGNHTHQYPRASPWGCLTTQSE